MEKRASYLERFELPVFILLLFMPDFVFLPSLVLFVIYWLYDYIKNHKFKWSFLWLFLAYAFVIAVNANNTQGIITVVYVFMLYVMITHFRRIMTPSRYNLMQYHITVASIINFFFNFVNMNPEWAKPVTDILDTIIARGHLPQFRDGYYRAYSTFDNPNLYAFILLLVLLIIFNQIELQIAFKRYKEAAFYMGAFMINSYALLLTQTRSILLALALGIIIILVAQERWTQLKLLVFIGSLVAIFILVNPDLFPRFMELENHAPIRYHIWDDAIAQIRVNPFFGEGFFTYALHFNYSDAHNIFLDTLINFGLFGSIIGGAYLIEIVYRYTRDAHPLDMPLALGILSATLVYSIFDIAIYAVQTSILLALVFIIPIRQTPGPNITKEIVDAHHEKL
ncbi:hypothetical protein AOC36_01150 [Erysipelothrix larvae]|uniref:O-antigen ligase-related domain-containing protein n=1 Tax=Erysipelothrix larvae TaxID=1514105 RepID=A0A0X8GY97_9FIRM|nr:O-antigen ligase family protein [Erysipelothrix larvae]AMC92649.1 hypothetical protein AOC36_01150 [Erysipelothrix larvae]